VFLIGYRIDTAYAQEIQKSEDMERSGNLPFCWVDKKSNETVLGSLEKDKGTNF